MKREIKDTYTFLEPGEMPRANAAILFSGISLAILLILIIVAFAMDGNAGLTAGAAGLAGALFAVYAFIIAMIALAKRESRYRLCVTAAIISGLMLIIWLTVFLNGLR